MTPTIRPATPDDLPQWATLRAELWPRMSIDAHLAEATPLLAQDYAVFLAEQGGTIGFAEAALRHDYVNGCRTSPVAFLEGIYLRPDARGAGTGRALVAAVLGWAQAQGCSECASDALLDNLNSHAFHRSVGFSETERVVYFRQVIAPPRG